MEYMNDLYLTAWLTYYGPVKIDEALDNSALDVVLHAQKLPPSKNHQVKHILRICAEFGRQIAFQFGQEIARN